MFRSESLCGSESFRFTQAAAPDWSSSQPPWTLQWNGFIHWASFLLADGPIKSSFKGTGDIFYLVGLFLSPMLRNFDSAELKSSSVTGENTHLAATQLSWKLLSKDDHVTRLQPITPNVITTEAAVNVTQRALKALCAVTAWQQTARVSWRLEGEHTCSLKLTNPSTCGEWTDMFLDTNGQFLCCLSEDLIQKIWLLDFKVKKVKSKVKRQKKWTLSVYFYLTSFES